MFIYVIDTHGLPLFSHISVLHLGFLRMWNATCVLSIQPYTQTHMHFSTNESFPSPICKDE